jgi:hypothetical protein
MAGTGADQYSVSLAFIATARHLPALTASGLTRRRTPPQTLDELI